jgi:hypothetical protein
MFARCVRGLPEPGLGTCNRQNFRTLWSISDIPCYFKNRQPGPRWHLQALENEPFVSLFEQLLPLIKITFLRIANLHHS